MAPILRTAEGQETWVPDTVTELLDLLPLPPGFL